MSRRRLGVICTWALLAASLLTLTGAKGGPAAAAGERPLVVGGGTANAAGWRFVVALKPRRSAFFCGGALIAPTRVLTAAHCVKEVKLKKLRVVSGRPWISGRRAAERIRAASVRIHPDYNGRKVFWDFAVITLASPAPGVPIALPTAREAAVATAPGRTVRVAGWGARSAWGYRAAKRLKSTRERVRSTRRCKRAYGGNAFEPRSMICALGTRVRRLRGRVRYHATSCLGDSGGPLVAATPAGPRLVGVVSVGPPLCGLGAPSIYSRVAGALRFIRRAAATP